MRFRSILCLLAALTTVSVGCGGNSSHGDGTGRNARSRAACQRAQSTAANAWTAYAAVARSEAARAEAAESLRSAAAAAAAAREAAQEADEAARAVSNPAAAIRNAAMAARRAALAARRAAEIASNAAGMALERAAAADEAAHTAIDAAFAVLTYTWLGVRATPGETPSLLSSRSGASRSGGATSQAPATRPTCRECVAHAATRWQPRPCATSTAGRSCKEASASKASSNCIIQSPRRGHCQSSCSTLIQRA